MLGYPDQARENSHEMITWAQKLSHPHSLAWALCFAAELHYFLRDRKKVQELAEAAMTISVEQGFPFWLERANIPQGWALAKQGKGEEGIRQIHQGLDAYRAKGAELWCPHLLAMSVAAYKAAGQIEQSQSQLTEALALVNKTGQRYYEAELYRLKGELTLQEFQVPGSKSQVPNTQHLTASTQAEAEAEVCFLKAIDIAQKQQAKSLELRAVMSLARLWQSQGKHHEARAMLSAIYHWFTEGFDTKDLQEAKALIEELQH
jgi:predicted ATPase